MNRQESLSLGRRLEFPHLPFSLSCGSVQNFSAILEILGGVMVEGRHDGPERSAVTIQLVHDPAKRNLPLTLQEI